MCHLSFVNICHILCCIVGDRNEFMCFILREGNKEERHGHDMKGWSLQPWNTRSIVPHVTLPPFIWFKVFKGQMALFVLGWPPSKPSLLSSVDNRCTLTRPALTCPDINGFDNCSSERCGELALCPH